MVGAPIFYADADPAKQVTASDEGCRFEGLQLNASMPAGMALQITRLDVAAEGLRALLSEFTIPNRIAITADDFYTQMIHPEMDPAVRFATNAQMRWNVVDMAFLLTHDPQKSATIDRFHLDFPGENEVMITAQFSGVDLTNSNTLQNSAATARLENLNLRMTTHGMFEAYVLFPLSVPIFQGSQDPETDLRDRVDEILGQLDSFPTEKFPPETRDALHRFMLDLPNPAGTIELNVVYDGGFGLAEAMALGQARFENLDEVIWPDFRVDMTYEQTGIDP